MRQIILCVFFFKQKTAYEMRISDWSSDVCSSDLNGVVQSRPHQVVDEGLMQTRAVVAIDEARPNGGPQRDVQSVWLGLRPSPEELDVEAQTTHRGQHEPQTTGWRENTHSRHADCSPLIAPTGRAPERHVRTGTPL